MSTHHPLSTPSGLTVPVPASAFARILQDAVHATPRALGGAFSARDGELVDAYLPGDGDPYQLAVLTAHYGVILAHLEAALGTLHFGGVEQCIFEHAGLVVLVQPVAEGYFALMAMPPPAPLGRARTAITRAATRLRSEMG